MKTKLRDIAAILAIIGLVVTIMAASNNSLWHLSSVIWNLVAVFLFASNWKLIQDDRTTKVNRTEAPKATDI